MKKDVTKKEPKMTERERELTKENKRLADKVLRLLGEVSSLESENLMLREELKNATPIRHQINEITQDEALKEIKSVLRRYGLLYSSEY